jgi:single-strand DNA-binding protein
VAESQRRHRRHGRVSPGRSLARTPRLELHQQASRVPQRGTWDRLAQVCGQYLGKGQQVAIEGRLQTRQWDDDRGARHWKTEVVATSVEMLSGRRKRDYEAETQANQVAESSGSGISPNEAAEVGVITAADAPADETSTSEDEQVLILA